MVKLLCGCTPDASGFGWCSACMKALNKRIWANMSEEKKAYDRHFDPVGSRALDEACTSEGGCYCHINPPCNWCIENQQEEEHV